MPTDAEKHVWEDGDDLVVVLPGGTREYVVCDVDASVGLWVQALTEKTRKAQRRLDAGEDAEAIDAELHLSDEEESQLYSRLLASTLDDLEADGVKWKKTKLVGQIAYAWVVADLKAARKVWEADGSPEPNRQARRSRASGSKTSSSGASATTTKRPASTRSTKTRT